MNDQSKVTTRDRILAIAAELFAERGFDGVSIRDITGRAEVNLGAITYHFGGKQQLFSEVIITQLTPFKEVTMKIGASDLSPEDKLRSILREVALQLLHRDTTLKLLFAQHGGIACDMPPQAIEMLNARNAFVQGIIEQGIADGSFRRCDVEHTVWAYFGMILPYVAQYPMAHGMQMGEGYSEELVLDIVNNALSILMDGIKNRKKI